MGIDDASIDESGLTDAVAAPDPLKNSSAEVDQAKAAETGAVRGESGDVEMGRDAQPDAEFPEDTMHGDEFEHAPDELERDLTPAERLPAGADPAVVAEAAHPHRQRGRVLTFLGHCIEELRRVQWPDRRQVGQATAVTLGFVVIAGTWLGLMDALWKPIVNAII
jgi:preprotein translocase SecE subunit